MTTVGVRHDRPHVYIKHVGNREGKVLVSPPCALPWQQVVVSNGLLGEREIGLMSDFKALDDTIDQTHVKFSWWEDAFVAHNP